MGESRLPEQLTLPARAAASYDLVSCLKYSEESATCLVRNRESGRLYLLKLAFTAAALEQLFNEHCILREIHRHDDRRESVRFPVSFDCVRLDENEDETACGYLVRTYIEGNSLETLCEGYARPGFSPEKALEYTIGVVELLAFLHGMKAPIIHRDIKPQNVLVDPYGDCHLIDFGISRRYSHGQGMLVDTRIMGTKATAPPEQFGYRQTDVRSDLYSAGILLYYCLTGSYEIDHLAEDDLPPEIEAIVRKATMFDPDQRYQSAQAFLRDLLHARFGENKETARCETAQTREDRADRASSKVVRHTRKPAVKPAGKLRALTGILFAACLILLGALAWLLRERQHALSSSSANYTDADPDAVYTFTEPLIETAVRSILNLPEGDITQADLDRITSLRLYGMTTYGDEDAIWFNSPYPWFLAGSIDSSVNTLWEQRGTISSLEDITHMHNLTELCLYNQQISDISVLQGTGITRLALGDNPLTDLSPLAGNTALTYLSLPYTQISDLSPLAGLTALKSLNLCLTQVSSLADLRDLDLEALNLYDVHLKDVNELTAFPHLGTLTINLTYDVVKLLPELPLRDLRVMNANGYTMRDLPEMDGLTFFLYDGRYAENTADTLTLQMEKLEHLYLVDMTLPGFSSFANLQKLEALTIAGVSCESFDGLDSLPALQVVYCDDGQAGAIQAQYPAHNYTLIH